jgi:subtilisin family serine protease
VWAVKVLNKRGSGSWSQVICGIDWATGTRTDSISGNDIAVANMSLGGLGSSLKTCATTSDALHKAICNSTAAGVTYVVAAGNDGWDFDYPSQPNVPAVYPEVLTVSAVSDSDGLPGGVGGAPSCRTSEADDRYASFSNYALTSTGRSHTVAGPGVCILSDWTGGGTRTISGTSMATPHLAGVVALCLNEAGTPGECDGLSPAQIIQKIRTDAEAHNGLNTAYGFTGDPLNPVSSRYYGYLAHVGMAAGETPPPPPPPPPPPVTNVTATPDGTTIETGSLQGGTFSSLSADDNSYYEVNSASSGTRATSWWGSFSGVSNDLSGLGVAYKGKNSKSCTQTMSIWNWSSSSWTQLDSRSVGTSEILVERTPTGTLANYVSGSSGDGELRVRVTCTRKGPTFYSSGDLMRIAYTTTT